MKRALALALVLFGCDGAERAESAVGEPAPVAVVSLASGVSITLPIGAGVEEEVDGDRHAFRGDDGVVWSVQTIPPGAAGTTRSLDEVAIALTHRVELGDVQGELTHRDCTFGGRPAQCIEGWQLGREGERVVRRGAIMAVGEEIVWVSVAAHEGSVGIDDLAEALAGGTRIGAAP